jgi:hypothetical protein
VLVRLHRPGVVAWQSDLVGSSSGIAADMFVGDLPVAFPDSKVPLFVHARVGTSMHKALLVHLVWHVAALAALGMLFVALRGRHAAHGMTRSD